VTRDFTPDEIEQGITTALHERKLTVVPSLIKLLALQDPARAQSVLDTIDMALYLPTFETR
jgi:hypothetical protein